MSEKNNNGCVNCGRQPCNRCSDAILSCVDWAPENYRSISAKLGDSLLEAHSVINGERQDSYGNPEDSFDLIGKYWSAYLGRVVTALDAANMMILFKMARCSGHTPSRDNYVDAAGYAAIAADRLLGRDQLPDGVYDRPQGHKVTCE